MKKLIPALLCTLFIATPLHAETASSESIRNLMTKTGAGDMGIQMVNQMLPTLKQMVPDAPEEFWQSFTKQINGNDIIEMTVPIYQKYLTQDEINAINAFYDSPAGKKLVMVQPKILQESISVGQAWGQKIALEVIQQFQSTQ